MVDNSVWFTGKMLSLRGGKEWRILAISDMGGNQIASDHDFTLFSRCQRVAIERSDFHLTIDGNTHGTPFPPPRRKRVAGDASGFLAGVSLDHGGGEKPFQIVGDARVERRGTSPDEPQT